MKSTPESVAILRENLLNRYADDRLDVEERAACEQWLTENPDDAQRMREWQSHNHALRGHYDVLAHAPVPERLLRAAKRASRRSPTRFALAAVWMCVGVVIGLLAGQMHMPERVPVQVVELARDAAIAHAVYVPEIRHAVEVGADQEAHLVNWLSKRLGTKLRIPVLHNDGFSLVGGRLLPGSDGAPVAQFMYQGTSGTRLTLYVRRDADQRNKTAFHFAQEARVSVFYWVDNNYGFALSGEVEKSKLLGIAQTVYEQLNP